MKRRSGTGEFLNEIEGESEMSRQNDMVTRYAELKLNQEQIDEVESAFERADKAQKEFESWLTYDVSDWYCTADLENGECEVSYLLTTDYGGFQFFRVYRTTAEWNDRSMQ